MNTLLFDHEFMAKYYNCSGRTYDEWKALGQPNVPLGVIYVILGIAFMIISYPFMMVFLKSDLMRYSCFKIMFLLGIIDCIQIPVGGFYCGYAAAVGMVYCMAPTANYIFGGLSLSCWCSGSTTCMLLAINRCIDLIDPNLGNKLFSGKKTLLWLMIPISCFIYFFFIHTTVSFNSTGYAFFFDPFVGTPERHGLVDSENYPHVPHSVYNVVVVVVLIVAYASLLIHLSIQAAKSESTLRMSKLQRQTFIQCTVICTGTFIAALVYVYMQFLPTPVWIIICGEIAWQCSHGAAGISYAFFNATMKKELAKIFCPTTRTSTVAGTTNIGKSKTISSDHLSDFAF